MPVLINLFGTVERVAWGMDREPHQLREVGETLAFLKQPEPPGGWREALRDAAAAQDGDGHAAEDGRIGALPGGGAERRRGRSVAAAHSDLLAGRTGAADYLAAGGHPGAAPQGADADRRDAFNLGIYRMQVTGRNTTLMRWLRHRGGAQHHQRWARRRAEPFPAAVVIGADPGTILAAVTPVPDTLSEYQFAGLLRGRKVELVGCKTVPLKVPAQAEIVLEGHVSLMIMATKARMATIRAITIRVEQFPVFTVSAITMRHDPIYLSTFTGRPPDEPIGARRSTERGIHSAAATTISRNRRFLAAARRLFLPHRRGVDQEVLSRPRQAHHDGGVVLPAAVHLHQIRHRGR